LIIADEGGVGGKHRKSDHAEGAKEDAKDAEES
jgi:hypothetical protein